VESRSLIDLAFGKQDTFMVLDNLLTNGKPNTGA
jgi:hypothetical protein